MSLPFFALLAGERAHDHVKCPMSLVSGWHFSYQPQVDEWSQHSLNIVESRCWGRLTPPLNIVETCWDMLRRVWIRLNFVSTSSQHFFCSRNVEAVWHALSTLLNTRKRSNLVPRLVRKSLGTRLAQQDGDRGRAGSGSPSQTSRSSFVERMLRPFDTARSQHLSTCLNNVERMLRQMLWPFDRGFMW